PVPTSNQIREPKAPERSGAFGVSVVHGMGKAPPESAGPSANAGPQPFGAITSKPPTPAAACEAVMRR
ncbi:hypothetical protein ADL26_05310, partial [Thermoactinomyces vulgaris]